MTDTNKNSASVLNKRPSDALSPTRSDNSSPRNPARPRRRRRTSPQYSAPVDQSLPTNPIDCESDSSDGEDPLSGVATSARQRFRVDQYVGKGSYGLVYKALDTKTGQFVAIKRIVGAFKNKNGLKQLLRELRILRELNHVNIIKLVEILPPDNIHNLQDLYLVFEMCDSDFYSLLSTDQHITDQHVQSFLFQLLCGVHYIHTAQIIHRDLKPGNLLVTEHCEVKICDFGLGRGAHIQGPPSPDNPRAYPFFRPKRKDVDTTSNHSSQAPSNDPPPPVPLQRVMTQNVVTREYRAPELILCDTHYKSSIDMWSVGCILAELLGMLKEVQPVTRNRKPLFAVPWSAITDAHQSCPGDESVALLDAIFDVIGTPQSDELSHVAPDIRSKIELQPKVEPIDFCDRFDGASKAAIDLLQKLLQFDPKKRLTAAEALQHPYLEAFIDGEDVVAKNTRSPIDFDFEDSQITRDHFLDLIIDEIRFYHPEVPARTSRMMR